MLKDNKDEAFDLLHLALTSPHFDATDVERIRAQVLSGLRRDTTNPTSLASRKFLEVAFGDHPYGRQGNGTLDSVPKIDVADMKDYVRRVIAKDTLAHRRGRRCRCRHARQAAGQDIRRTAGQGPA
jgi:zinc protease